MVHPASLVDSSLHSPAMLQLLETKMSRTLIEYVVDCVVETVHYAMGRPSSSRGRPATRLNEHAKFTKFVTDVLSKAEVKVPVLLVTLVYIDRAKPHLQIALEQWACERVFLGALILANKYVNDSTLKNVHWALCTGVFGKRDVGRIEREFLDVLDFELGFHESDILSHHSAIISLTQPTHHHHHHQLHFSLSEAKQQTVRTPLRSTTPNSHWSSDSSDDSDSDSSSADSASMPRTPDVSMDVDPATTVVSPSSKMTHSSHPHLPTPQTKIVSAPVQPELKAERIHAHSSSSSSSSSSSLHQQQQQQQHHARFSAMNILRSFPMPHFHHHHHHHHPAPAPAPAPSIASSSSSSTLVSSSSSSASSCSFRPCKPITRPEFTAPRTASVAF